jgi:hypothetical protein
MAEKGVQVNATVPKEWDTILEDHRWNVRKTKTQLVKTAVEEYLVNHGLLPESDADGGLARQGDETA